jgi:hypothetical protein
MNRAAPGFAASLQFVNFPFETEAGSVNLAMSRLLLSRNGLDLKVEGSFGEIERYKSLDGYNAWKLRADSLLSGSLKPQGLDYAYAMSKAATKDVVKSDGSGNGLGWRGQTRIAAFAAAVALGSLAVYKHFEAEDYKDKFSGLSKEEPNEDRYGRLEIYKKKVEDSESQRLICGIGAGVFALGGAVTFFF